jgi:hypothetical protein
LRGQVQLLTGDDVNPAAKAALSTAADANAPKPIVETRHAGFLNTRSLPGLSEPRKFLLGGTRSTDYTQENLFQSQLLSHSLRAIAGCGCLCLDPCA